MEIEHVKCFILSAVFQNVVFGLMIIIQLFIIIFFLPFENHKLVGENFHCLKTFFYQFIRSLATFKRVIGVLSQKDC